MKKISVIIMLVLLLFTSLQNVPVQATSTNVIYVNAASTGAEDGKSWATAYKDLQLALAAAKSGDEIWIAKGTYKPTSGTDRTASFQMKNGVAIYGGFSGTETTLAERDFNANKTILSGDIGAENDNSDNSYHVFYHPDGLNLNDTAILDGVTITGGQADGSPPYDIGGGMSNYSSSPRLTNVTISGNEALAGGGMHNYNSSLTLTNVTLSGNKANGGAGGGMHNASSSLTLTNVTISGNEALAGGGMSNASSSPTLTNVTLSGNTATYLGGGGMYNYSDSSPTLTNVTISGNTATATAQGGGMYNEDSNSSPNIHNSIVVGNSGTGIYGSATITNSLIGDHEKGKLRDGAGIDVGNDHLLADIFLDPTNKDYRLKAGSPAIDKGDSDLILNQTTVDLDGNPRRQGAAIDLGAYESPPFFKVSYDGNGATSGQAPVNVYYEQGNTVTVAGNTGNLVKTGYTFAGWNTKADGTGTKYAANATFQIAQANVTLYAQWAPTATVKMTSSNTTDPTRAKVGDTITLQFETNKEIQTPTVKIAGKAATVTNAGDSDAKTWLASYEIQQGDAEGLVPFTLDFMDLAGNVAIQVTAVTTGTAVTVDKTAPVVTGVQNGAIVNNDVTITFDEGTATLNNNPFSSGDTVGDEGAYNLIVTDTAGNSTTIAFTIDKTAPVVTGIQNGASVNNDVTIAFNEGTATLNSNPFSSGDTVGDEGAYNLIVTDTAGNTTTIAFTIDKTVPVVTGVQNGDLVNNDVTITFNEGTATLNGNLFSSGDTVKVEGAHSLIVTDTAGNNTTIAFTIDKTAPVIAGIQNGAIVNNDVTITFNEGTATLNNNLFSSGDTVTVEGTYNLIVTDTAGNNTTIAFTIDKTGPVVTGIQNGAIVNNDVTITFNKGTATLNSNPFSSGDTVIVEGTYNLIVTDTVGNTTTIAFTIDKTAPTITINGVENNKTYQQVTPIITSNDAQATLTTTLEREGTPVPFTQGSVISQAGNYTLTVKATDLAGNETTETVSFSIYVPSPPVGPVEPWPSPTPDPIVTPPSPPVGPVEPDPSPDPGPIVTLPSIESPNMNVVYVLTNGRLVLYLNGQPVPIVAVETTGDTIIVQIGKKNSGQTSPINETGEITFPNSIRKILVLENEEPFRYFETATNVSPQKEWDIRLSLPVKIESVNFENVVVKDAKGNVIETELQLSEDGKTIKIIPKQPYQKGEIYYLTISGLQSEDGQELKESIRKIFIITQ